MRDKPYKGNIIHDVVLKNVRRNNLVGIRRKKFRTIKSNEIANVKLPRLFDA